MTSGTSFGDRNSRPYRKRRPLPALIVIGVLGIGALAVWVYVITSKADIDDAIRCDPPASPPPGLQYTTLQHGGLDDTSPIPPGKIAVKVLNATKSRGQAAITTESLRALGFTQTAQPDNDPAYAGREAVCRGQIRFGENGAAAARTVSLVNPCLELVKDTRQDATVDVSVGGTFTDVRPKPEARQVLQQLVDWSAQHQEGGGEQSAGSVPKLDQTALASARDGTC